MEHLEHLQDLQEESESEAIESLKCGEFPSKSDSQPSYNNGKLGLSRFEGFNGVKDSRDGFSLTQLNTNDWFTRNKKIIDNVERVLKDTDRNGNTSKTIAANMAALSQNIQQENFSSLSKRAKHINEMKTALDRTISAMMDEMTALEEEEIKIQNALIVLAIPESITKECIAKRAYRPEAELILDDPENELIKELTLISEIKIKLRSAISEIQETKVENRSTRERLEHDWSDKSEAYEIESIVCGLNNCSTSLMIQPGVTRVPAEQSSEQFWEHFTNTSLSQCEKCRIKSVNLRGRLSSMILCVTRDLRIQADNTERALTTRSNCTREILKRLENELERCLKKLTENENSIEKMVAAIKSFDVPTKVAHTRLDYRIYRPNFESCNDRAQRGLIDEVITIENGVSNMLAKLKECQENKNQLIQNRQILEREIILKRKTIMLDGERCMMFRSRYPSATALSGFINI